jgi:hypothetical protein
MLRRFSAEASRVRHLNFAAQTSRRFARNKLATFPLRLRMRH